MSDSVIVIGAQPSPEPHAGRSAQRDEPPSPVAPAEPSSGSPASRERWAAGAVVVLVEASCAAVMAAFSATGSIWVTLIVAGVAVLVVAMVLWLTGR